MEYFSIYLAGVFDSDGSISITKRSRVNTTRRYYYLEVVQVSWKLDVGIAPNPKLTLERKDNSLGYIHGNVVWADRRTQANNRRSVKLVSYKGETLPLSYAADLINISYKTLFQRLSVAKSNCLDGLDYPLKRNRHV
jgi:hypothetical protein